MIRCEKCEQHQSTVLVIDEPDYPTDPVAGWFMCESCFEADPDGWYEVLDAEQFGPVSGKPKRKSPRVTHGKRAGDELIEHAYQLHADGMRLVDVAREVMKVHPYKNVQSACASLRKNFAARGLEVQSRRRSPVAA